MHRRLLGRPTFGRWEIDSYFNTAARQGFFGVVDALIDSEEYQTAFGDDTVRLSGSSQPLMSTAAGFHPSALLDTCLARETPSSNGQTRTRQESGSADTGQHRSAQFAEPR